MRCPLKRRPLQTRNPCGSWTAVPMEHTLATTDSAELTDTKWGWHVSGK